MDTLTTTPRHWLVAGLVGTIVFVTCAAFFTANAFGMVTGGHASKASFCKAAVADYNKWSSVDNGDGVSTDTQKAIERDYAKLAAKAPHEIKADMKFAVDSIDKTHNGE